jgi:hypothetical protein
MKNVLNDNDPLPFITLSAATERAMAFLKATEQKKKDTDDDAARGGNEQEKTDEHTKYVDTRLREFRTFERRAAGFTPAKRKT